MEITDAMTFGLVAVKVGLLTQRELNETLEDVRTETGKQEVDLIHLTRALERRGLLTNFQTGKLLKGEQDGFVLGGYRILYKISSGSFGRVFRAVENADPRGGRVVAVKVLRRRWSEDQQRIDLFIREGKMGLTLKHPNIVEVLAINQDPVTRQYYIIMEFVEGGNLREILQARARTGKSPTLSVPEALRVLDDCANGLAYAYSRGLTHRDIKLTNILVSSTGDAKLVDFGLAQMFAAIGREEEQVDRTVDYAGLEKATGVKSGDVRSDIFFLGCVLYETLTGKPPLVMTKDRHARMARRRFEDVVRLRPGEITAPPSVYGLCDTMLSVDPRKRYQTPSQLLDAVRTARREVESGGGAGVGRGGVRTVFVAESNERMQEGLRSKFKEHDYRVLIASDPFRALDRFRQQPYDLLVVDAASVGEDGLMVFDQVLREAENRQFPCAGVLILDEDQAEFANRFRSRANAAVLMMRDGKASWKQLYGKVKEVTGEDGRAPGPKVSEEAR